MASGRGSIVVRHYVPAPALFVKRADTPGSDSQPRREPESGVAGGRRTKPFVTDGFGGSNTQEAG